MLLPSHLSNTLSCCILLCLSSIYFSHSCYLLAETNYYYITQGLVPILSVEAIHQLHIFIFVLAVSHVVLSAVTVLLGIAQVLEIKLFLHLFVNRCHAFAKHFVHYHLDKEMATLGEQDPSK